MFIFEIECKESVKPNLFCDFLRATFYDPNLFCDFFTFQIYFASALLECLLFCVGPLGMPVILRRPSFQTKFITAKVQIDN